MAPRKGNLMTVRTDVKVLDATIRDGGLCNNFEFTDEFVTELYKTNIKSGVDYMEFGYRASKNLFDPEKFGKWKFCDEEDIRSIVGDNVSDLKIAVMADVGRCDFKEDFVPKSESVIDMVRVACYIHQIPAAIEMIEHFHNLGYETTCNIMAISQANNDQLDEALEMLGNSSVDVVYLVDSYGSLYPESAGALAKKYLEMGEKYGKAIGFQTCKHILNIIAPYNAACFKRKHIIFNEGKQTVKIILGILKEAQKKLHCTVSCTSAHRKSSCIKI